RARFAMLLISQNFVSSDFIHDFELPWIKERVVNGGMFLIPILVGPVVWEEDDDLNWLSERQMLPGKPQSLLHYKDDPAKWASIRVEILAAIKKRVRDLRKPSPEPVKVENHSPRDMAMSIAAPEPLSAPPVAPMPQASQVHREDRWHSQKIDRIATTPPPSS